MSRRGATVALLATLVTALVAAPPSTSAQTQSAPGPRPAAPEPARPEAAPSPHPAELDCRKCHQSKHQGIVQMYGGAGGRGAPRIPSHMFQVRVECIACHTTPKIADGSAGIVGQTFKASEQACVACHGEKYRGMLQAWVTTLGRMREAVAPKLAATQGALGTADLKNPRHHRARKLVADAEFNTRFVALAKGVHNVFYAADLLKLSSGWLDEAAALLGKSPAKTEDQLVRGGYCAVLCHDAAGVKPKETVTFARQSVPHARHVTEFGATCTSCHSAETHKAVTATRATCGACHHSSRNERCESCHQAQSAFYRGTTRSPLVTIEPNLMAEAVPCTACHDFSRKPSRAAIGQACVGCHEPQYLALMPEWTTGFETDIRTTASALRKADEAVARARRGGRTTAEADARLKEAREALALVRRSGSPHNPLAADALLAAARQKAEQAQAATRAR